MSEKCSVCGLLADPCFCYYSNKTLITELKRRQINKRQLIKTFQSVTEDDMKI